MMPIQSLRDRALAFEKEEEEKRLAASKGLLPGPAPNLKPPSQPTLKPELLKTDAEIEPPKSLRDRALAFESQQAPDPDIFTPPSRPSAPREPTRPGGSLLDRAMTKDLEDKGYKPVAVKGNTFKERAASLQKGQSKATKKMFGQDDVGTLRHMSSSFMLGATNMIAAMPEYVAIAAKEFEDATGLFQRDDEIEDRAMYKLGQAMRKAAVEWFPQSEELAESFLYTVLPQGAGSLGAFMALGVAGKTAGLAAWVMPLIGGATMESANMYLEAQEHGATEDEAFGAWLGGHLAGALEAVPVGRALARFDKISGGGVKKILANGFVGGVEELVQEVSQTMVENYTAQLTFDKERDLMAGTVTAGGAGGILGAVANMMIAAAGLRTHGGGMHMPQRPTKEELDEMGKANPDAKVAWENFYAAEERLVEDEKAGKYTKEEFKEAEKDLQEKFKDEFGLSAGERAGGLTTELKKEASKEKVSARAEQLAGRKKPETKDKTEEDVIEVIETPQAERDPGLTKEKEEITDKEAEAAIDADIEAQEGGPDLDRLRTVNRKGSLAEPDAQVDPQTIEEPTLEPGDIPDIAGAPATEEDVAIPETGPVPQFPQEEELTSIVTTAISQSTEMTAGQSVAVLEKALADVQAIIKDGGISIEEAMDLPPLRHQLITLESELDAAREEAAGTGEEVTPWAPGQPLPGEPTPQAETPLNEQAIKILDEADQMDPKEAMERLMFVGRDLNDEIFRGNATEETQNLEEAISQKMEEISDAMEGPGAAPETREARRARLKEQNELKVRNAKRLSELEANRTKKMQEDSQFVRDLAIEGRKFTVKKVIAAQESGTRQTGRIGATWGVYENKKLVAHMQGKGKSWEVYEPVKGKKKRIIKRSFQTRQEAFHAAVRLVAEPSTEVESEEQVQKREVATRKRLKAEKDKRRNKLFYIIANDGQVHAMKRKQYREWLEIGAAGKDNSDMSKTHAKPLKKYAKHLEAMPEGGDVKSWLEEAIGKPALSLEESNAKTFQKELESLTAEEKEAGWFAEPAPEGVDPGMHVRAYKYYDVGTVEYELSVRGGIELPRNAKGKLTQEGKDMLLQNRGAKTSARQPDYSDPIYVPEEESVGGGSSGDIEDMGTTLIAEGILAEGTSLTMLLTGRSRVKKGEGVRGTPSLEKQNELSDEANERMAVEQSEEGKKRAELEAVSEQKGFDLELNDRVSRQYNNAAQAEPEEAIRILSELEVELTDYIKNAESERWMDSSDAVGYRENVRAFIKVKEESRANSEELKAEEISKVDTTTVKEKWGTRENRPWETHGPSLGAAVYHGGKEGIQEIDESKLQRRDSGFYGEGFYVADTRKWARTYGTTVTKFEVDPDATVLNATLKVDDADARLVEAVVSHYRKMSEPNAKAKGKMDLLELELKDIKTSNISWARALDKYAAHLGIDIVKFSGGEILVKNPKMVKSATRQEWMKSRFEVGGKATMSGIPGTVTDIGKKGTEFEGFIKFRKDAVGDRDPGESWLAERHLEPVPTVEPDFTRRGKDEGLALLERFENSGGKFKPLTPGDRRRMVELGLADESANPRGGQDTVLNDKGREVLAEVRAKQSEETSAASEEQERILNVLHSTAGVGGVDADEVAWKLKRSKPTKKEVAKMRRTLTKMEKTHGVRSIINKTKTKKGQRKYKLYFSPKRVEVAKAKPAPGNKVTSNKDGESGTIESGFGSYAPSTYTVSDENGEKVGSIESVPDKDFKEVWSVFIEKEGKKYTLRTQSFKEAKNFAEGKVESGPTAEETALKAEVKEELKPKRYQPMQAEEAEQEPLPGVEDLETENRLARLRADERKLRDLQKVKKDGSPAGQDQAEELGKIEKDLAESIKRQRAELDPKELQEQKSMFEADEKAAKEDEDEEGTTGTVGGYYSQQTFLEEGSDAKVVPNRDDVTPPPDSPPPDSPPPDDVPPPTGPTDGDTKEELLQKARDAQIMPEDVKKARAEEDAMTLPERMRKLVTQLQTALTSQYTPLREAQKDIYNVAGEPLPVTDAATMAEINSGMDAKAMAEFYPFREEVIDQVKDDYMDFNTYIFLRRTGDRLKADPVRKKVGSWTVERSDSALEAMREEKGDEAMDHFERIAEKYQEHADKMLDTIFATGIIDADSYDKIKADNDFYALFKVAKHFKSWDERLDGGGNITNDFKLLHAITGIQAEDVEANQIVDIVGETAKAIYNTKIRTEKQMFKMYLWEMAALDKNQKYFVMGRPDQYFIKQFKPAAEILEQHGLQRLAQNRQLTEPQMIKVGFAIEVAEKLGLKIDKKRMISALGKAEIGGLDKGGRLYLNAFISEVMIHELGHTMDIARIDPKTGETMVKTKKIWGKELQVIQRLSSHINEGGKFQEELKALVKMTKLGGKKKYRHSAVERFAEFMNVYVHNPALAHKIAPKWTLFFETEIMAKNKKISDTVEKLSEFYVKIDALPNIHTKLEELGGGSYFETAVRKAFPDSPKFLALSKGTDIPEGFKRILLRVEGKQRALDVRADIYESLENLSSYQGAVAMKFLGKAGSILRGGATVYNATFMVKNAFFRDPVRLALLSKYGLNWKHPGDILRFPLDWVDAIRSAWTGNFGTPDALYMRWLKSGAGFTDMQSLMAAESLFEDKTKRDYAKPQNILNTVGKFASALEQSTKLLGFKRAIRMENFDALTPELQKTKLNEIAAEIRRYAGSPDFWRHGMKVKGQASLMFMFLNARIQGVSADLARLGSSSRGYQKEAWLNLAVGVGLPTLGLAILNYGEDDDREYYEKQNQVERHNYYLIPKGTYYLDDNGDKRQEYWTIPKDDTAKIFSSMVESFVKFWIDQDPESFKEFGLSFFEDISPIGISGDTGVERLESAMSSLNPVLKTPFEMASARNFYYHTDVIPRRMENYAPEDQKRSTTPEIFVKLGGIIGESPLMLEHLTRNITASGLTQFAPLYDLMAGNLKIQEGRGIETALPVIKMFSSSSYGGTEEQLERLVTIREAEGEDLGKRYWETEARFNEMQNMKPSQFSRE